MTTPMSMMPRSVMLQPVTSGTTARVMAGFTDAATGNPNWRFRVLSGTNIIRVQNQTSRDAEFIMDTATGTMNVGRVSANSRGNLEIPVENPRNLYARFLGSTPTQQDEDTGRLGLMIINTPPLTQIG